MTKLCEEGTVRVFKRQRATLDTMAYIDEQGLFVIYSISLTQAFCYFHLTWDKCHRQLKFNQFNVKMEKIVIF